MSTIIEILKGMSECVELMRVLLARIKAAQTDRKVADDVKTIADAFRENDASKLNHLFSSK